MPRKGKNYNNDDENGKLLSKLIIKYNENTEMQCKTVCK